MTAAWNPTAAPETERLGRRFVCRVSGAPADGFEALRGERTAELAAGLLALDARAQVEREAVSALLFDAIGAAADRPTRNRLLALKRTLYNLRPAATAALDAGCAPLAPDAAERVRGFAALLEARAAAEAGLRAAHGEDSARVREGFRALLRDPDFRKGLLVSSRSLHGSLERYAAAGATLSGRDEKTERGLLRYYTRMAMKATPFSVFCAILPGRFTPVEAGESEGPPVRVHGDPRRKRSFVRINKTLYGLLLDHLKTRPAVRRALVVEANPTLRTEGGRLVFLTALQSREVFQRVAANDVLTLIGNVFRGRAATTLGELTDALVADPQVDATAEEAAAYLDKLLEIGFLRFHTGIREQDADWDLPLRALLEGIDDDHARRSAALLAQVRAQSEAYAVAGPEARAGLIQEMLDAVTAALESMEVTARLRKDMPFYEDATADAEATAPLTPGLARAVEVFTRWVRLTSRLAWPRPEGATMRHFFDSYYDAAVEGGVPLLQFYEDFYREHFKGHVEKEQKLRAGVSREELAGYDVGNPYGLEFIRVLGAARGRLAETVRDRWIEAGDVEEVAITLDDVERALADVPAQAVPCRSVDAFVCLAPPAAPGGDERVVLGGGSYTAGYGKYFSRFLYMLPDEVTEAVRRGNGALTDEYLAEICGDSQFNANLHPPLLRWEISYPTGESGAAEDQLRSSELLVARDPHDPHALLVRHAPTGRRVLPVDLGFLNPRMRPPLYQLLSRFTVPVTFAPSLPESPERRPAPTPAREAAAADAVADAVATEGAPADAGASAEDGASAGDTEGTRTTAGSSSEAGAATDGVTADATVEVPPRVVHRPRITVEGRLVLARRRWLVPGVLFPQREGDESAADFFVRVQRWRAEHGLPGVAYLRIAPLPDPAARKPGEPAADAALPDAQEAAMGEDVPTAADGEADAAEEAPAAEAPDGDAAAGAAPAPARPRTAGSRDLHKPQFMDFGNPLLVGLLGKMAANLRHFQVVVEERLPDRDGLAPGEGGSYVSELVVQLDFPAAATAAETPAREEAHAAVV